MKILGIGDDVWISSAALIEDGYVVAAAPEERFNRRKMSKVFPDRAIDFCLRQAGCGLDVVERIVVAWNPGAHIRSASSRYIGTPRWRGEYLVNVPGNILSQFGSPEVNGMAEHIHMTGRDTRIDFVNHHLAHAASAFFPSPFDKAAILTVDGRGEEETCTWSLAQDNQIKKLQAVYMPHSLGLMYGTFTEYLGFRPHSDEWKVMALAPYGKKGNAYYPRIRALVNLLDDGRFELDLSYFAYYFFDRQPTMYTSKLTELLGPSRNRSDSIEQRHCDIAWTLQQVFEETFAHMLVRLHSLTGESRLAIAGGCAMNSVYNGKIAETSPFKEVFISSCPDDSGVSVGAALYGYHCLLGGQKRYVQEHNYWGPSYSTKEIEDTLRKYKIRAEYHNDIVREAARLLSKGKLMGWFQGAMEFGQRALGNRSILADPRDAHVKDLVNAAVKYRESFRPFAPAILEERAREYCELPPGVTVPFMEKVYPVRPDKRELIPAVVHVDGTARLQTVSRQTNPRFYDLIWYFGQLTGVPVLLNTSFNLNGEPIVCSPTDAIRTFYSCGLDALVLGDYLVLKES
jgi:carbamoyltransferase